MLINLQFQIERDTNNKFGIAVIAVAPDGVTQGQPARIHDSIFSTAEEAAERLVCGLRGALNHPAPGVFGRHFLFPTPELAKHY